MIRFISRKWQQTRNREQISDPTKSEAIIESNGATKILTDVIDDCLEHIFLYLSLEDLLNVVHTNKQLKPAAESAFVRNFGQGKLVVLKKHRCAICINETEQVELPKYQTCRLLRSFGHLILKQNIKLWCYENPSSYKIMFKHLNQYCHKSTSDITFSRISKYSSMKQPFYKAETVCFDQCQFSSTLYPLNKFFPNVRNLCMDGSFGKSKHIAAHFPHLNQLEIKGGHMAFRCKPQVKMLRMNPQIRRLILDTIYDKTLLPFAGEHLQFLEHIHIFCLGYNFKHFGDKTVNFKRLKELKITEANKLTKIPISSNCLEVLSLHFWDTRFDNMDILIDFLKKHPTISKISLTSDDNMVKTSKEPLIGLIETLSSMEEIDISMLKMSVNHVIQVLNHCKVLKKLCFKVENTFDFDRLRARLGVKWQVASAKSNNLEIFDVIIVCSK